MKAKARGAPGRVSAKKGGGTPPHSPICLPWSSSE